MDSRRIFKKIALTLLMCIVCGTPVVGFGQASPTPTPDPDLERRNNEAATRKTEADARKSVAEARKQEIDNRKAEIDLLSGSTTVSGDLIEKDITAYRAASCAVPMIRDGIPKDQIAGLIVYDSETSGAVSQYSVLVSYLGDLVKRFDDSFNAVDALDKKYPASAPVKKINVNAVIPFSTILSGISAALSPAIDIISLFKVDEKITGSRVAIARDDVLSMLGKRLGVTVYFPSRVVVSDITRGSAIWTLVNDLLSKSGKAAKAIKLIAERRSAIAKGDQAALADAVALQKDVVAKIEARLKVARPSAKARIRKDLEIAKKELEVAEKSLADDKKATERLLASFDSEANDIVKQLNQLIALTDTVASQLQPLKGDSEAVRKFPTITDYLRAESLLATIKAIEAQGKRVYWLDVTVSQSGGTVREKGSPITDIFTRGKSISFSGGAIVSYRVIGSNGAVLASDAIMSYVPYKKLSNGGDFTCNNWVVERVP